LGGMTQPDCCITTQVTADRFDVSAEMAKMRGFCRNIGAICSFVGLCRDEGGVLTALEIEHYPAMATQEIAAIAAIAAARFPLYGLTIIHRYGHFEVGEEIVLVLAAAQHRASAFGSVDFVMELTITSTDSSDNPLFKYADLITCLPPMKGGMLMGGSIL